MKRLALKHLVNWKNKDNRKPLLVRGARQVGKSYLVREFAAQHFDNFLEINFEESADLKQLFLSNSPREIVSVLELRYNQAVHPGKSLIF